MTMSCSDCRRWIDEARLAAVPEATRCRRCAQEIEDSREADRKAARDRILMERRKGKIKSARKYEERNGDMQRGYVGILRGGTKQQ